MSGERHPERECDVVDLGREEDFLDRRQEKVVPGFPTRRMDADRDVRATWDGGLGGAL